MNIEPVIPPPVPKVDPARWQQKERWQTGMHTRALDPAGNWRSVDIAVLDSESVLAWLRSRGGRNPWAEQAILYLLGHVIETETIIAFMSGNPEL